MLFPAPPILPPKKLPSPCGPGPAQPCRLPAKHVYLRRQRGGRPRWRAGRPRPREARRRRRRSGERLQPTLTLNQLVGMACRNTLACRLLCRAWASFCQFVFHARDAQASSSCQTAHLSTVEKRNKVKQSSAPYGFSDAFYSAAEHRQVAGATSPRATNRRQCLAILERSMPVRSFRWVYASVPI